MPRLVEDSVLGDVAAAAPPAKAANVVLRVRALVGQLLNDVDHAGSCYNEAVATAGANLYGMLRSSSRKDEAKGSLQVLRDEIGRAAWAAGEYPTQKASRDRQIDTLFKLFDEVEWRALEGAMSGDESAAVVFDELRARFHRLITGEKWDGAPRLRAMALRRVYAYRVSCTIVQVLDNADQPWSVAWSVACFAAIIAAPA